MSYMHSQTRQNHQFKEKIGILTIQELQTIKTNGPPFICQLNDKQYYKYIFDITQQNKLIEIQITSDLSFKDILPHYYITKQLNNDQLFELTYIYDERIIAVDQVCFHKYTFYIILHHHFTLPNQITLVYIYFWIARSHATAALRPQALQIILNTILNITLIQSYLVSQLLSFHHTTTLHKPPSSLRSSVGHFVHQFVGNFKGTFQVSLQNLVPGQLPWQLQSSSSEVGVSEHEDEEATQATQELGAVSDVARTRDEDDVSERV
ncbi:Hypothetical_protein [Hexamita inflata]|uniref:Hypothetical_protein n=1 Tax=Hexamita inflata TaxID=28002 RepID=A0ABP1HY62_9EUKA